MTLGLPTFVSAEHFENALENARGPNESIKDLARARQAQLTKPPGSLGELEDLAIWLAGWHGTLTPVVEQVQVIIFAGNHGVTAQGVSPYPAEVTQQMVANFQAGGGAINAMSDVFGYDLSIVALDLDVPTHDFTGGPAMTHAECLAALNAGAAAVNSSVDLLVLGEMGIGNTTAASAMAAATFGGWGADWAGPGTGLTSEGVAHKSQVIDIALQVHRDYCGSAFETLRRLGGRELAAIAGAVVHARLSRFPVMLDGFVSTAATAPLIRMRGDALAHCLAGHVSAEPGHRRLLQALGLHPILDLEMRLGEATGAAIAAQVLIAAAATHAQMATFSEAGVQGAEPS